MYIISNQTNIVLINLWIFASNKNPSPFFPVPSTRDFGPQLRQNHLCLASVWKKRELMIWSWFLLPLKLEKKHISKGRFPYHPRDDLYIYLACTLKSTIHVGKYASPLPWMVWNLTISKSWTNAIFSYKILPSVGHVFVGLKMMDQTYGWWKKSQTTTRDV